MSEPALNQGSVDPNASSIVSPPVSVSRSHFRVCVSNLNYYTTEEELEELLSEFNVVSVLIPSYTVHFSRTKFKPLGIAYAEFVSLNDANKAIEKFNGFSYKERQLRVRYHVPVKPRFKLSARDTNTVDEDNSTAVTPNTCSAEEDPTTGAIVSVSEINKAIDETVATGEVSVIGTPRSGKSMKSGRSSEIIHSLNILFLSNVPQKLTEEDIKEYFSEDSPTHVYRWKQNRPKRGSISFRHSYAFYFVVFDIDGESKTLDDIIEKYRSKKLKNRHVLLRKAIQKTADRAIKQIEEVSRSQKENEQVSLDEGEINTESEPVSVSETKHDTVVGDGANAVDDVVIEDSERPTIGATKPAVEESANLSSSKSFEEATSE